MIKTEQEDKIHPMVRCPACQQESIWHEAIDRTLYVYGDGKAVPVKEMVEFLMAVVESTAESAKPQLRLGAWYTINFGDCIEVCVIAIRGNRILWECPQWNFSRSRWQDVNTFFGGYTDAQFIGYGKRRWIMGWIRKHLDCIGTIYSKPKHRAS